MASKLNKRLDTQSVPTEEADYEQLLDDYSHFAPPGEGELLQGHVLKVTDKEVIVDFGYKSEGLVPIGTRNLLDGNQTLRLVSEIDNDFLVSHLPSLEGY